MTPLITSPIPPPAPNTELTVPMPRPTFAAGNSSRMIPKESGNTAAPAPWSTRKATSEPRLHENAAPSEPKPKTVSASASTRFFP